MKMLRLEVKANERIELDKNSYLLKLSINWVRRYIKRGAIGPSKLRIFLGKKKDFEEHD
jgi:hypothetical protein